MGARGSPKARLGDSCTAWTLEGAPVSAGCLCGWGWGVWKLGAPTRWVQDAGVSERAEVRTGLLGPRPESVPEHTAAPPNLSPSEEASARSEG